MKCHHCEKPALIQVQPHIALCLDCHTQVTQNRNDDLGRIAYLMNTMSYLDQKMEYDFGLRTQAPVPPSMPAHKGQIILNHINVSNSTVGSINTGTIHSIDIAIGSLKQSNHEQFAAAIRELTEAVLSTNRDDSERTEIMEFISCIAEEATKPTENRKNRIVQIAMDKLGEWTMGAGLTLAWEKFSPLALKFFHLVATGSAA